MEDKITDELLNKYFKITGEAIQMIKEKGYDPKREKEAADYFDMATRYYSDAQHFRSQGKYVLAYGALNYSHGWLDAGARIGLFLVKDSRLFTVDDE